MDADEAMHLHPLSFADTVSFDLMFNPPLFRLLVQGICRMSRTVEAARLVPLAAGLGAIYVTYLLALSFAGTRTALFAAALLAFHPWHIRHSQTVRSFTLLTLLVATGFYLVRRANRDQEKTSHLVGHSLTMVGALLTHYLAVWPIAMEVALSWWKRGWKRTLLLSAGVVAVGLGLLLFASAGLTEKVARGEVATYMRRTEFLIIAARCLFGTGGLCLLAALTLTLYGFARGAIRQLLLPVCAIIGGTICLGEFIPIEPRYCLPALPFLLIGLAEGTRLLYRRATGKWSVAAGILVSLAVLGLVAPILTYYSSGRRIKWALTRHPDLAHVQHSLSVHTERLVARADSDRPVVIAARGPLHYRMMLELHHGGYPDDAVLEDRNNVTFLEAGGYRLAKLDLGDDPVETRWSTPAFVRDSSLYFVLMERSVGYARAEFCTTSTETPEFSLWECRGGSTP